MLAVSSTAFQPGEKIPSKYTCDGANVNPSLRIESIPPNTTSLVLIVDDPDAPVGTWTHWIMWNIDPSAAIILENSVPRGASEGLNDAKATGWSGPCPPSGVHRYYFRVWALDKKLDLPGGTARAQLEEAMRDHVFDRGELMGRYTRD